MEDIVVRKQDDKPSMVYFRNVADYIITKSFKDTEIQKLSECESSKQQQNGSKVTSK